MHQRGRSHVRQSTIFYQDLSNIYLKGINNQRFKQSERYQDLVSLKRWHQQNVYRLPRFAMV